MLDNTKYRMRGSGGRVHGFPEAQGLYDPQYESEACGVGFVVNIDGIKSNRVGDVQICFTLYRHTGNICNRWSYTDSSFVENISAEY